MIYGTARRKTAETGRKAAFSWKFWGGIYNQQFVVIPNSFMFEKQKRGLTKSQSSLDCRERASEDAGPF